MTPDGNYSAITGLFRYIKVMAPTDRQLSKMTSEDYGYLDHRALWKSYPKQYDDYAVHSVILKIENNEKTHNGTLYFSDNDDKGTSDDNTTLYSDDKYSTPKTHITMKQGTTTTRPNKAIHVDRITRVYGARYTNDASNGNASYNVADNNHTITCENDNAEYYVNNNNNERDDDNDANDEDVASISNNNTNKADDNNDDYDNDTNEYNNTNNEKEDNADKQNDDNDEDVTSLDDNNASNNHHNAHDDDDNSTNSSDNKSNNDADENGYNANNNDNNNTTTYNNDTNTDNEDNADRSDDSKNSSDDSYNATNEDSDNDAEYDENEHHDHHNETSSAGTPPTNVDTTIITPQRCTTIEATFKIYGNNNSENFYENKNSNENFYENKNSDENFYNDHNDDNNIYGNQLDFYSDNDYYNDGYYDWGKFLTEPFFKKHYLFLIIIHCHSQLVVPDYYISGYVLEIPPEPPPKLDNIDKCVSTLLFHV